MSNRNPLPPASVVSPAPSGIREYMETGESGQYNIARQMLARMHLKPGERILELNCGTGAATQLAAQAVVGGSGMVAALDPSPDKIAQARAGSRSLDNVLFAVGQAEEIPWRDDYFNHVFSTEDFGASRDPKTVVSEVFRVLAPGGHVHILTPLGEAEARVGGESKARGHLRCEEDYKRLLEADGFEEFRSTHISDSSRPEGHCEGTLLFSARKPETEKPAEETETG
jgi:SAM-dependent methyltransferase